MLTSIPVVETTRLTLRLPQESDAIPLMEIHQDPEVSEFVLGNPAAGATSAWRTIAVMLGHWHLRGYGHWTIVEHGSGDVIGRVGLWNPEGWPGIELGWVIRRSRWGEGFATEAARAALDWAWHHVATGRIISIIRPDNHRSIRVAHKLGATLDRTEVIGDVPASIYVIRRPEAGVKMPT